MFWGGGPSCDVLHATPIKTFFFVNFIGLLVRKNQPSFIESKANMMLNYHKCLEFD